MTDITDDPDLEYTSPEESLKLVKTMLTMLCKGKSGEKLGTIMDLESILSKVSVAALYNLRVRVIGSLSSFTYLLWEEGLLSHHEADRFHRDTVLPLLPYQTIIMKKVSNALHQEVPGNIPSLNFGSTETINSKKCPIVVSLLKMIDIERLTTSNLPDVSHLVSLLNALMESQRMNHQSFRRHSGTSEVGDPHPDESLIRLIERGWLEPMDAIRFKLYTEDHVVEKVMSFFNQGHQGTQFLAPIIEMMVNNEGDFAFNMMEARRALMESEGRIPTGILAKMTMCTSDDLDAQCVQVSYPGFREMSRDFPWKEFRD